MKYGYIRVSTREQDETRQIKALKKVGILEKDIFIDKSTGTTFIGRESWQKLLAKVVVGDTITIKELDRLGRNNKEVKETFELVSKKGVFLEFLEQPLLNTYGKSEIERELLQPLILHLLGYFAEKENEKRKTRQKEAYAALPRDEKGRIVSRKKNKVVGRPNILENITGEQKRLIGLCSKKEITIEECMNLTKFSRATIYKLRKNLFPDLVNNREISNESEEVLRKWKNKEISTKDCMRLTGYSRTYLYKLLEKNNI
jgi:DNA invertase Pin-like site-specific DNA recombinase